MTRPVPAATPRDPASELGTASRAVGDLLDVVAETAQRTHRGVSRRVFRSLGPLSWGVRPLHDAIAGVSYRSVRLGLRRVTGGLGAVADHHPALRRATPLSTRGGLRVRAAASGIVGDRVAREHPELDVGLAVFTEDGHELAVPDAPARPPGDATEHVVVLVHGLCEDERSWQRPSRCHRAARRAEDPDGARVVTHGRRLAAHGWTPLYVRYNTGLPIRDNGRDLARLLTEVQAAWPVAPQRIALVGHSMGGLVLRCATQAGVERGHRWPELVGDIVYLGTPHLGAPLARGVDVASRWLARLPETEGLSGLLEERSAGVRDLTHASLGEVDEGRHAAQAPATALREAAGEPPPLPGVRHHLVTATITRDPDHPVGRALGDLMVRPDSGRGRSRGQDLGLGDDVLVRGGTDHFDLLSDPVVGEQLERWLDPDRGSADGAGVSGEPPAAP